MTAPGPTYWEDVEVGDKRRYGPFTITTEMLEQFLEVVDDQYALHRDEQFAAQLGNRGPILPGTLIHAAVDQKVDALGRERGERRQIQLAALRSVYFDFVRPLHPEEEFWVDVEVLSAEAVTDELGTIEVARRVTDAGGSLFTMARVRIAVLRRPAGAA